MAVKGVLLIVATFGLVGAVRASASAGDPSRRDGLGGE
jgi:hypothetical protein